jgi:gamma-glutamyltranspeptidase/glutathione hydrolase
MIRALIISLLISVQAQAMPVEGHQIMISGPTPYAVETGRRIARQGGNLVDVAVAVALTLSVTSPYYAALGGGGLALVKMDGPVEALDFRETAPAALNKDYFIKLPTSNSISGGLAVGVPGVPAGLVALHKKYGHLKWEQLFAPAIELATRGFAVSGEWVHNSKDKRPVFTAAGLHAFFSGGALRPGDVLKQPALARALTELKDKRTSGFYAGAVAKDIVNSVRQAGGVMTLADLQAYKVRWLAPMTAEWAGQKLYLMPPPSSGGVIIKTALQLIDKLQLSRQPLLSLNELHLLSEIEARAYRGRGLLGDPDFHRNPVEWLTSTNYTNEMAQSVDLKTSHPLPPLKDDETHEKTETTHFSVMDNKGHAIAMTITLNGGYGSGVVSDRFHIALNDEIDDFNTHPNTPNMYGLTQGTGNSVEGGKRPLSSMTPTLVEKDGKIVMSLGAPGGPRITSAVLQVLYRILMQNLNIDLAIQTPRIHHQFSPNKVFVENSRLSPEIVQGLKDRGHAVEFTRGIGKVYVVRLRPDGVLEGAFDARGEGAAGGI